MGGNRLKRLEAMGQSVWLDFIRRGMLDSGEMARLIDEDGLGGVTSNPAIFEKAIAATVDYDAAVAELAREGKSAGEIYEELAVEDIRRTADLFLPLYERTAGRDGFVSLEVSPHLARDTEGTILEARRLWQRLERSNVMIKVPGTAEGLPAIRRLIAEGINVNVTLLFGLPRYRQVVEAYLAGLEERLRRGEPLERPASVASFFLSRIDVMVDPLLEEAERGGGERGRFAAGLKGEVAIASAKSAWRIGRELFESGRFRALARNGAREQRLLWASTGTKNPAYPDTKYVEPLIGPGTVNTMPMETLTAYRDHGNPAPRLEEGVPEAQRVLERLAEVGIDLDDVTARLEEEGIGKFTGPFDALMAALERKRRETRG